MTGSANSASGNGSAKPRRTRAQRSLIAFNIFIVVACLGSAAGLTWFKREVTSIPRLSIPIERGFEPEVPKGDAKNYLLVGIDNATGLRGDDPVRNGRGTSQLTDTIMILRVDPIYERAAILSLPRDLYVRIPPDTRSYKINHAYAFGGISKLIETIYVNFGIPIHHYAIVDFAGFENLVDLLDGVPMYFPWPAQDTETGLYQFDAPGCITLDGSHALAFARSRHLKVQVNGEWVEDSSGDIGRARRQQEFMRNAMRKAINRGARNPITLSNLISLAQKNVQLDEFVSVQELIDVSQQMKEFDPDELETYTPPAHNAWVGQQAVLILHDAEAHPIFDIFRGIDDDRPVVPSAPQTASGLSAPSNDQTTTSTQSAFIPAPPEGIECG
ncbi:MAG: LCP family protein [Acidimicrobiales bacterium]|nr:LCP family protein [Acidimicrobiales bacterium]